MLKGGEALYDTGLLIMEQRPKQIVLPSGGTICFLTGKAAKIGLWKTVRREEFQSCYR